jgi:Outer membrane lipoprotein carrier protein LolA-like
VAHPTPSTLVIRGDALALIDGTGTRSLDLAEIPIARAFVDTLRMLLTGDFAALRAAHEIEFSVTSERVPRSWLLRLRPRTAPLRGVIDRIEVGGAEQTLAELRIVEVDGDETRTRFSAVDAAHLFTPAELDRLFPIAAP